MLNALIARRQQSKSSCGDTSSFMQSCRNVVPTACLNEGSFLLTHCIGDIPHFLRTHPAIDTHAFCTLLGAFVNKVDGYSCFED
jgi:hypothetical protein